MLKMRLGATPVTEVKIPYPAWLVSRSSQWGMMTLFMVLLGKHAFVNAVLLLVNWILPLLLTFADVNS